MIKLIFCLSLLIISSSTFADETYHYVGWSNNDYKELNFTKSVSYSFDTSQFMDVYKKASGFYGFNMGNIVFAVPDNFSNAIKEWKKDGVDFYVDNENVKVQIFGREYKNLTEIRSDCSEASRCDKSFKRTLFLYSKETGLVGFCIVERGYTYWLRSGKGVGAVD